MPTRRTFMLALAGAAFVLPQVSMAMALPAPKAATAITEVFGHGLRLVGVALEFDAEMDSAALSLADFAVVGRTVTGVLASASTDPADAAARGRFVIVTLDPEDEGARLYSTTGRTVNVRDAKVDIAVAGTVLSTTDVNRLVVDDFQQLVFEDGENGIRLMYNLFVPKDYDPARAYPLVNFMHDASVTSTRPDLTLIQGLGAVVWASPEEQAKRPCFVLAPQFDVQVVNDASEATGHVDTVKRLIDTLAAKYPIDRDRLYTTGQSGGGMLSIAMDIKYPDLFAASLLVACQWNAEAVEPMKDDRLFIVVAEEDAKALPGQNAITAALEGYGATVNRAVWNGRWSADEFASAYRALAAERAQINYVVLKAGTVIPEGTDTGGAAGHMNTWPIAYAIEPLRQWLFDQRKA